MKFSLVRKNPSAITNYLHRSLATNYITLNHTYSLKNHIYILIYLYIYQYLYKNVIIFIKLIVMFNKI